MPLLHLWQEHFGFISDEGVRWIAAKLELAADQHSRAGHVLSDVPAGAGRGNTIRVCRTLSCAMAGGYELMEKLVRAAGIDRSVRRDSGMHNPVSVSADGKYSIEFVECLASCGTAPVCMVEDELHENVPSPQPACRRILATIGDRQIRHSSFRPIRSNVGSFSRTSAAKATRPTSIATCATAATSS